MFRADFELCFLFFEISLPTKVGSTEGSSVGKLVGSSVGPQKEQPIYEQ